VRKRRCVAAECWPGGRIVVPVREEEGEVGGEGGRGGEK